MHIVGYRDDTYFLHVFSGHGQMGPSRKSACLKNEAGRLNMARQNQNDRMRRCQFPSDVDDSGYCGNVSESSGPRD